MKKKWKKIPALFWLVLSLLLVSGQMTAVYAEEETEYIPEAYYDAIQSNEISGWPQGEAVQSESAVVMDLTTGTLLYSKNAYDKQYPASITKIMTTLVALENGRLEDVITFSEHVYDLEEGSSHVGIQPGEEMTLRQALYALMLESANDAGVGIAEHIAGSIEGFAELMNAKAEELGCVNTHFTNPHGLHSEEHYTCAYDMALIAQAAYENPTFREMVSCTQSNCPETNLSEERYFVNHHKMIQTESDYYAEWCTGGKTGYTSDAWNTLVTYGEKNGRKQVCVVLRVPGAAKTYEETTLLMNYGFDNFTQVNMVSDEPMMTFYEAMKLNYVGLARTYFQSEQLYGTIGRTLSGVVTIPSSSDVSKLTAKSESAGSGMELLTYQYQDWQVGSAILELHPIPTGITLPFERKLDMEVLQKNASSLRARNEIEQTALTVYYKAQEIWTETSAAVVKFTEANKMMMLLGGGLVLLVLLVIIFILILRCTKEARIQKRRRQEEKERLKKEEEIDRMTTAEIEQELRAAMEQERLRRQEEAAKEAEARRQEEKLCETEQIVDGLEKES